MHNRARPRKTCGALSGLTVYAVALTKETMEPHVADLVGQIERDEVCVVVCGRMWLWLCVCVCEPQS